MALVKGNLAGTKDGSNKAFTLSIALVTGSEFIVFNTSVLKPVASNPGPTQCIISGQNVTLGMAPQANDDVWYYGDSA